MVWLKRVRSRQGSQPLRERTSATLPLTFDLPVNLSRLAVITFCRINSSASDQFVGCVDEEEAAEDDAAASGDGSRVDVGDES